MKSYVKDRRGNIAAAGLLWLFLDLYLGVLCSSSLYLPDVIYLNLLLAAAAGAVGIWDYRRWKILDHCLRDHAELTEKQERELMGKAVSDYVRREREEQEAAWKNSAKNLEELSDYIAGWTHEAKLPLASLRLMNERNEDMELRGDMQECIVRLETLVQTVLVGSKLQRPENDVRYERISLEEAVKNRYRISHII